MEASLKAGGPLKGALFWQFYAPGQTASEGEGGGSGRFGIYPGDSTFQLIKSNAGAVQQLASAQALGACSPQGPAPAGPCAQTGFEGPGCDIDINECVRSTAGCAESAVCINSRGSFSCECPLATTGDPKSGCTNDTAALSAAVSAFYSDPTGQACDPGQNVPYPQTAVGWAEDPTGGFDRKPAFAGGFGARLPVTEAQCAVACQAADGCEAFTYNPAQQGCFLKAQQCPLKNDCQPPEELCTSVSDMGKNITVNCGTWTTHYKKEVWDQAEQYCSQLPAPAAGNSTAKVAAFSG